MKDKHDTYEFFLAALRRCVKMEGHGGKTLIAARAEVSKTLMSQILKVEVDPGKKPKRAGFESQVALAQACGYEYDEFLKIGRGILVGDVTTFPAMRKEATQGPTTQEGVAGDGKMDPEVFKFCYRLLEEQVEKEGKALSLDRKAELLGMMYNMVAVDKIPESRVIEYTKAALGGIHG